jgi:hypothetical protein
MDVAAQSVQLGDDNRRRTGLAAFAELASMLHGRSEFRPALKRIGALAGLYLTILGFDLVSVVRAEQSDRCLLGFQTETAATLLGF